MNRSSLGVPILALAAALQAGACGGANPPVTVVGAAPDLRTLSGTWVGEYASPLTGRNGSIVFELAAGGDSAWGRVIMTPRGAAGPLEAWRDPRAGLPGVPTDLTIRFVRVRGDQVTGALTPYPDPRSGDPLFTVFEGRATADTIAGTFTTRPVPGSDRPTGWWRAVRER